MNETQLVIAKLLGVFLALQLLVTCIRAILSPRRVPMPDGDEDILN